MLIILVFAGSVFSSCNTQNSKNVSTDIDAIVVNEDLPLNESEEENSELVKHVKNYLSTKFLTEADLRAISEDQRKFQIQEVDLNNDGKREVFVNFMSSYFCGTGGCTILLLNDQIEPITKFTVTRTPLYIEKSMENDWRTILTQSEGKWRKLIYKGGSYPTNPSIVKISSEAPSEGADIIFDDNNKDLKTYNF